ncbi:hypothetical protein [Bradyrhizobium sp. YR681]|uniref:hypothetical protein n=1 Tax=Bradyrhizobium sp. YR681 TaxID=1144344 RepID=UPI00138AE76B|nr:hypothetical protein [Bradyrhizobium sp. YR681]
MRLSTNTNKAAAANSARCLTMNARGEVLATTAFCATGMTAPVLIPELAALYAARASGAAICKTTIKKITLVLNGRTQERDCAILFQVGFSIRARAQKKRRSLPQRKTALPQGTRLQRDPAPS